MAEDRREYRERVLRERAERIASHLYMLPGYEELWQAILAALRQTAEEEREAAYSDWDLRANAAYAQGERAGSANMAAVVEALACDAHPVPDQTAVAEIVADLHSAVHRAERQIAAVRALWPHIEIPRGDVKVGGERWHAPTVDPGAPTCLRCKIEGALNAYVR